jgi:hypothetical protein
MKDKSKTALDGYIRRAQKASSNSQRLTRATQKTSAGFTNLGSTIRRAKRTLVGFFAVREMIRFNSMVMGVTATMAGYQAVLANTLQNQQAGQASFQMITEFARKTPFQVDNLTGSFVKLVNRGFMPTRAEMTQIGDVAASQGKKFDQYVEAILDAQTGEFERLKEFGITARKQGDLVAVSFKGQTKTIAATNDSITNYLVGLGKLEGVSGSMDVMSQELGGKLSNLSDTWGMTMYAIGTQMMPLYDFIIDKLGAAIGWIGSKDFSPLINSITNGVTELYFVTSSILSFVAEYWPVFKGFLFGLGVYQGYLKVMAVRQAILSISSLKLGAAMNTIPIFALITGITLLITLIVHAYNKVGWFRGAIDAIGTSIKGFAYLLKDALINRFKELISGVTGVGRAISLIFKGEFSAAADAGKQAMKDLAGYGTVNMVKEGMRDIGKNAFLSYVEGYNKAESNKSQSLIPDKAPEKQLSYEAFRESFLSGRKKQGGTRAGADGSTSGLSSVVGSGGNGPQTINLTLGSIIENWHSSATDTETSMQEMEERVQVALARVLKRRNQSQF